MLTWPCFPCSDTSRVLNIQVPRMHCSVPTVWPQLHLHLYFPVPSFLTPGLSPPLTPMFWIHSTLIRLRDCGSISSLPPPPSPRVQIPTTLQNKAEAIRWEHPWIADTKPTSYLHLLCPFAMEEEPLFWLRLPLPLDSGAYSDPCPEVRHPFIYPSVLLKCQPLPPQRLLLINPLQVIPINKPKIFQRSHPNSGTNWFLLSYYHFLLSPKEPNCLASFPVPSFSFSHPSVHCILASIPPVLTPIFCKILTPPMFQITYAQHWERRRNRTWAPWTRSSNW